MQVKFSGDNIYVLFVIIFKKMWLAISSKLSPNNKNNHYNNKRLEMCPNKMPKGNEKRYDFQKINHFFSSKN